MADKKLIYTKQECLFISLMEQCCPSMKFCLQFIGRKIISKKPPNNWTLKLFTETKVFYLFSSGQPLPLLSASEHPVLFQPHISLCLWTGFKLLSEGLLWSSENILKWSNICLHCRNYFLFSFSSLADLSPKYYLLILSLWLLFCPP